MILPCLALSPGTMAIIFSPEERLHSVQVLTFARYKIKAITINQDNPNDPALWKVCIYGLFVLDYCDLCVTFWDICDGEYSEL